MTDGAKLMLLSPYDGPSLRTANRTVMAPMTRNRAGEDRVPNAMMATYYAQRATAGMLVTESVDVSVRAIGYPGTPGIYTKEQVEGWKRVVAAVRDAQPVRGPFFLQLFHTGRVSHVSLRPDGSPPLAPSAIPAPVELYTPEGMQPASPPRAIETSEISALIEEYVQAGRNAIEAGFDGVEINAGNGYLVDQFLRDGTNQRTDRYGGSVTNRVRLLAEIAEALAGALGKERVGARVSPINQTNGVLDSAPAELFTKVAEELQARGIAYLHAIEHTDEAAITPRMRERFRGALIANDGYDRDRAERALREGLADLVSFARLFLANPDLPRRFELGAPLNDPDPTTFYGGTDEGYTSYPSLADTGARG